MTNKLKRMYYMQGAAMTSGMMLLSNSAFAASSGGGTKKFNDIAKNIAGSIEDLPGLLTALAYLFGIILGVLGIMKIKDHVENPSNTPLKDGAIRLAAGGALFALPIVFEAMFSTVGDGSQVELKKLNKAKFTI